MIYLKNLRRHLDLSEQELAGRAGLSRLTVRQVESDVGNPTLESLEKMAGALERDLLLLFLPRSTAAKSDVSTVAVSIRVHQDGFESWPLHFMELVDEFRKQWDMRLLLLPPTRALEKRLVALLASICVSLCEEAGLEPPSWASRTYFLEKPWFVSETRALQALALIESPLVFRRNNIFVHDNFLKRA